jgi:hypothetical protein
MTLNSEPSYLCIEHLVLNLVSLCGRGGKIVGIQPPGIDNLDGKLLRMVADCISLFAMSLTKT